MSKHPECDPNAFAFPIPLEGAFGGLTKREYFAGLQMAASRFANESENSLYCAREAVEDADALIVALNAEAAPGEEKP